MNKPAIERPHYFSGEALLTADFICEQQYHMTIQSLNNRSLYTYGVARGLEVFWDSAAQADQVEVRTGMALDSLGRQIILLEPRVVRLANVEKGATYFLTISYDQVFADYTDQTGVAGYKRVVEEPRIEYVRNLREPGLNIVLAVIAISNLGAISQLTYRSGTAARRYVSATLGALELVTEGAGVHGNPVPPTGANGAQAAGQRRYPSLRAKEETSGLQPYLEVEAARTQFTGLVTTRDNVGIGVAQPSANLQIEAVTFKGVGALSSTDTEVTFSQPVSPFFQPGDVLISDPPVTLIVNGVPTFGIAQRRTVVTADAFKQVVIVDQAFNPPLQGIPYTYIRSTLARFSASADTSLFSVGVDGTVGIGVQASVNAGLGAPGPNALSITPDRRVGIGLTDRDPAAALDVNGKIQADDLAIGGSIVAQGAIQAKSFEGNGSKLQGLPMLSYWTREMVGTPTSNLYYDDGNVGIRDSKPIASLSVGGGQAFIGKGVLNSLTDSVLDGYQTAFLDQVTIGDTITIGMLIAQTGVIERVVSDTELTLQEQLPIVVTNSAYEYQPPGSADKTKGKGMISTNGVQVIGSGTNFAKDVAAGGKIVIARFESANSMPQQSGIAAVTGPTQLTLKTPFAVDVTDSPYQYVVAGGKPQAGAGTISTNGVKVTGAGTAFTTFDVATTSLVVPPTTTLPQTMLVKSVDSQTRLTLILPDGAPVGANATFSAATSAYVVTPALLAFIAANSDNSIVPPDADVPPALVVTTNGDVAKSNTVAINVPLDKIQTKYALQVDGDVNFGGATLDVDHLVVKTIDATQRITVAGDGSAPNLLAVGEGSNPPLLAVTSTQVTVGPSSAPYALDVNGAMHANGNVASDATVQGKALAGGALQAAGTQIADDGSVKMIGARVPYTNVNLTNNGTFFSQNATTDGYVMATIGQPTWTADYCGSLAGETRAGNNLTSFAYATGLAYHYETGGGKKGSPTTIKIPVPGAFTMPVRKGETWTLTLSWNTAVGNAPGIEFYWIPLGPPPGALALAAEAPVAPPDGGMAALHAQLRSDLASGRIQASMQASAQRVIAQRMEDLTQVFGNATGMSGDEADRQSFVNELARIVCSPEAAPRTSTSPEFAANVERLVDTFARVTGRTFTPAERELLAAGVRALVEINDSDANRHDLNLIRNHINLFIDNVEQAMQMKIDNGQRRLLTRALVRLVGDGSVPEAGA
ncbi:hypothetical protein WL40_04945 [Burkholderia ubonensis]|uniref:DUF1983 domain-containing protein n=1 Tax=Burkholderia ubonensis TaxID=101571 RepID=A0ABD4E1T1_9BURK|nr:hypothetical protein [Burkholderia ubonensis]KVH81830.1 hypothetical protein WJ41_27470 [Burkholderia ubonensis]KVM16986.1 hypothetical protein WJ52_12915 [Burkholderia ubonensis]KVM18826.1 hypothetical protein WJ51_07170 [Burkholderia ubonensis]KVM42238.1 hypothetical protein WJ56_30620 [Burkholderia ubonensis]KVN85812.1 hypothetical protein WJ68_12445 [Burkholderia ubonensis]